jgi:hypothetical protein
VEVGLKQWLLLSNRKSQKLSLIRKRAVFAAVVKTYSALKSYSCVCYSQSVHTGINSSMTRAVSQIRWKPGAIAVSRRSHTTAFFKWERSQTVYKAGIFSNWSSLFPKQYTKQEFKSSEKGIVAALQEGSVSGLGILGDPTGKPSYDDPALREIWLLPPGNVAGMPVQRIRLFFRRRGQQRSHNSVRCANSRFAPTKAFVFLPKRRFS